MFRFKCLFRFLAVWFGIIAILSISSASTFASEKPEIFVQLGHSGPVHSIAVSPDGRYALSGAMDNVLKQWDMVTGREMKTFRGHTNYITAVAISRDGKYAASASADDTILLWKIETGRAMKTFSDENDVTAVIFSPEGDVVTGNFNGAVKIWNIHTGSHRELKNDFRGAVLGLMFLPGGKQLVVGRKSGFSVVDVQADREERSFGAQSDKKVETISFSPDGRYALMGRFWSFILWDVQAGKEIRTFKGHSNTVNSLSFSPDGKHIVSGGADHTVRTWDAATGKELRMIYLGAYGFEVTSVAVSPDGKQMLSGCENGSIKVWDIFGKGDAYVHALGGAKQRVTAMALSKDGRHALTGSEGGAFTLWDMHAGKELWTLKDKNDINSIVFSPQGQYFLTAGGETVKVWDAKKGALVKSFKQPEGGSYPISNARTVAYSSDGKYAVSGGRGNLMLLDMEELRELRVMPLDDNKFVEAVAISPDVRYAASGGGIIRNLKLWDIRTGRNVWTADHGSFIYAIDFSPNGRYIVSGAQEYSAITAINTLKLWDVENGRELRNFSSYKKSIYAAKFSPDGRYLFTGGDELKLWNVSTGREVLTFEGHVDLIRSVTFAGDGRYLLSAGWDSTMRIWDASSGKEVGQFISFTDGEWIVMTPEGYFNASPNGAKHLNVRVGNNVYGIDQFYAKFYRPELVQLALACKALPQGELITDIAAQKPAPNIQILSPVTNSSVDQDNVAVTLKITDSGGGIGSVNVYLNGAQVANDTRGVIVKGTASANEKIMSFTIPLIEGQNEIRAVAFNGENSMESNPALINVISNATARKPNLYALVIGINTYKNQSISLTYAVPDAVAFAETLQKIASPLFEKADVRTLITPAATTKEAITKAFEEVRQMVKPNDLFVFYDASHGMVDLVNGEEQYFLLTSNVLFLRSEHISEDALSHKDLVSLIGSIPAQKKIVILDTCNAGKGGKEIQIALLQQTRGLTDATAVKLLQRAVGSSVFSASADTQQALEGYNGHGLFTYVLLEGLQGKADFKKDGFITVKGLALHTEERVLTLSEEVFKRQQTPMIETGPYDFPIGKIR